MEKFSGENCVNGDSENAEVCNTANMLYLLNLPIYWVNNYAIR